ncbi:MAG: type II secretion system F family protein, partial [Nanoarchaeota archaeon]|nr:type II secretion system F family protein [Nanoarchaeota archaeon]
MAYGKISRILYPKKIFQKYKNLLEYANIKTEPASFLGFILVFGFLLGWAIAFPAAKLFGWNLILTFIIIFVGFEIFIYMWLVLSVDAKAKFIERALPDALQLMSSNLRAGLTPEKALLLAARPEFGPLTKEINRMGKEITIGRDIDEALIGITKRIKSDKVSKTIMLIVTGIRSGGELASLLDHTSRNLREQDFIEQKIRSSINMYVIFIFTAVGLGAPMLYALSSFLVEVLTKVLSQVEMPKTSMAMPITISAVSIDPGFI